MMNKINSICMPQDRDIDFIFSYSHILTLSPIMWTNYGRNIQISPWKIVAPTSLNDIVDAVRLAEEAGRTVRAFGDGHSFSSVAVTGDMMIRSHAFARPLSMIGLKDDVEASHLVHVEAGIRIRDLVKYLRSLPHPLGLPNMGGYDGQAIIGAIATGTHGSGHTLGPLADMVRSVTIVAGGGKVYRVEPTQGISDPAQVPPDITLVQDDQWFHSVVVGMGCMGVIYSIVIEVVDDYVLVEDRRLNRWPVAKTLLNTDHNVFKNFRHQEMLVNPYKVDGENKVLVTARRVRKNEPMSKSASREAPWMVLANGISGFAQQAIQALFVSSPEKIPSILDGGLAALRGTFVAPYNNVFLLGIGGIDGYASEVAVPFERTEEAAERVIDIFERVLKPKNWRTYATSPFSLRFVAASPHYMSPQYGRLTTMIELPFVTLPDVGVTEESRKIMSVIHRDLIDNCEGRLHWGLEFDDLTADDVKATYPKWNEWASVVRQLDPAGTFRSEWTRRMIEPLLEDDMIV